MTENESFKSNLDTRTPGPMNIKDSKVNLNHLGKLRKLNLGILMLKTRDGSVGPVSRCREHFTEIP